MITYNPLTIFRLKDEMGSSNPDKIISGVPFDAEFESISQSFALAATALDPTFVGTVTFETAEGNVLGLGEQTLTETDITGFKVTSLTVGTKETAWDLAAATVGANGPGWDETKATVDTKEEDWDEAHGWGNHADAGYAFTSESSDTTYTSGDGLDLSGTVFSHADTSSVVNRTPSGSKVVAGMTFDEFGHVQSHTTGTLTGGTNISVNGLIVSTNPSLTAEVLVLGNGWFVEENNGTLKFRFLASNSGATFETKMELSSAGDLKVAGDVVAFATL